MFSVIIPLYNKQESIRNTIQSVLDQKIQDFEIIVIDDGSTDASALNVIKIQDPRIRLIQQNNQGVSAARNRGIQEAKYEWIAFLDGDDLWKKNHLEEVVKMMSIYPNHKVLVTSFKYSDNRETFKHERANSVFEIEDYFKEAISEEIMWTSIVIVHKECFLTAGFFSPKYNRGEDLDVWARLAKKFSIIKSEEVTAIYKIDAENRTNLSKNLEKCYYYNFPFTEAESEFEKKYYMNFLFNRVLEYFLEREYKVGVKLIRRYPEFDVMKFIVFLFKLFASIGLKWLRGIYN